MTLIASAAIFHMWVWYYPGGWQLEICKPSGAAFAGPGWYRVMTNAANDSSTLPEPFPTYKECMADEMIGSDYYKRQGITIECRKTRPRWKIVYEGKTVSAYYALKDCRQGFALWAMPKASSIKNDCVPY